MNQFCKTALAGFLNLTLITNQVLADLPPITFDTAEWVPMQTVGNGTTPGWELFAGTARISPLGAGLAGGQALSLPVNAVERGKITRAITWDINEKTAFIDFQLKPAADPGGSYSTFTVNGTQMAFQVPAGTTRGEIWVLNGKDTTGASQWVNTAGTFDLAGNSATGYTRVTLRHDYQRNIWDFFVNGNLVAVNMSFEERGANLTAIDFYGSQVGETLIDDVSAQAVNMLFPDADKDGLPDSWEIAHGSNPYLYDRDSIDPKTGKSFLDSYLDSLWPTGVVPTNGANITPQPGGTGIPSLASFLSQHASVGSLKGSLSVGGDGSAAYSVPIDLPKGTGGMEPKLSLNYSSNGGNGIMGLGWSLGGLQTITRGPSSVVKDGEFDPADFDDNDRFFLDGERLVCVAGTYGAPNSEYRTEMDSYARITAVGGSLGAGPASWKVETKAGLIVRFGQIDASRIAVSQGRLSWSVDRVQDTVGNYYDVEYTRDAANADFDFINQRVRAIHYTGNVAASLLPYCHVYFDYETRPDVSRAYSKYLGSKNSKRLYQIRVLSGGTLTGDMAAGTSLAGATTNHTYPLTYDTSYQSNRSRLISINKTVPGLGGSAQTPTTFTYDGLQSGDPIWKDPGTVRLPTYGTDLDATGEVNSMVTVESEDTMIRLSGDVARAYKLDTGGQTLFSDSVIQFDFRSLKQNDGAMIGLDDNRTYEGLNTSAFYRIGGTGTINMSNGFSFSGPTQPYATSDGWKTFTLPIGALSTGTKNYLVLMCVDNESSDGYDNAYFSNVKIYRSAHRIPGDDTPMKFAHDMELPRFLDASGKDLGVVSGDFNSDGLPDLIDWRATDYAITSGSGFQPLVADTNGAAYRNVGGDFVVDSAIRPPNTLPVTCRSTDTNASAYNKKHHLLAQPMDIDADGDTDLMGSLDIKRVSGQIKNQYGFYSLVSGVWVEKPGWRLPFSMENTASSVETGGNRRDEHFQWVDLNSDGYLDLVVHTTGSGRLYDRTSGALLLGGNDGIAYLNKGKNGPGWIRDDSRKIPQALMEGQQDVGRRLLDVDGDGVVDMVESSIYAGNLRSKTYKMSSTGTYRWNSGFGLENPPNNPYDFPLALVKHDDGADQGVLVMDLNADGMPDLLQSQRVNNASIQKSYINQGNRNSAPWQLESVPGATDAVAQGKSYALTHPLHYESAGARIPYGFEVADVNGDGLPDIVYSDVENSVSPGPDDTVFLNTGNGWENREPWSIGHAGSTSTQPKRIFTTTGERENNKRNAKLQDLNGDGFPDLVTNILDGTPKVWYNNCRPEVLRTITDGFGTTLKVNYNRLNDPTPIDGFNLRVYDKNDTVPLSTVTKQAAVIDSRLVVSSYSEPFLDQNGSPFTKLKYQRYGDLRYDHTNDVSLGFGWVEALDPQTGQISHTDMYREFPFAGSPLQTFTTVSVKTADVGSRLPGVTPDPLKKLTSEAATYAELPTTTGVGGKVRRPVQIQSMKILWDLTGKGVSVTITDQPLASFDAFGFVHQSTVTSTMDGSTVVTESNYDHYTVGGWLLGRLKDSTVTKAGGGRPTITKKSSFTYGLPGSNSASVAGLLGILRSETIEHINDGDPPSVTKSYGLDDFGNVTSTSVASGGVTRTSTTSYDDATSGAYRGRFVRSETNQLGHSVSYKYDDEKARLSSTTVRLSSTGDLTTSFAYDVFGTLICTTYPNGTQTAEITSWASNPYLSAIQSHLGGQVKFMRARQSSGSPEARVYLDSLGRELCSVTTILKDAGASDPYVRYGTVYVVTKYDAMGRKRAVSEPFTATETPRYTTIDYDFLSRVIKTTHPDGTYDDVQVFDTQLVGNEHLTYSKTRSRDGKLLERWEDRNGRLVKSVDPSGQATTFTYDQEGRMVSVAIDSQTLLTNTFDTFGNKTSVTEANSGTSSSVYDGFGQVTSSTNARGQTTSFTYDCLGRPLTVSKPEVFYTTTYDGAVNGIGKPWKTTGSDGYREEVMYDTYGRVSNTRKTQFGETSYTYTTYDALGRVYGETDAGGLGVIHEYDGDTTTPLALKIAPVSGSSSIVGGGTTYLWRAGTYDSKGRVLTQTVANGVTTTSAYDDEVGLANRRAGSLRSLVASKDGTNLQQKAYEWDSLGNLKKRDDLKASLSESFTYDLLNRLQSSAVTGGTMPATETYEYDNNASTGKKGNLTKKGTATLTYGGSRPHAVTTATIKGESRAYTYDAAGYVTSDSKRDYTWTSFGQLTRLVYSSAPILQSLAGTVVYTAARVQTDFAFDAGGNRAKQLKVRTAADSSRELEDTLYLGSYEREIHSTQTSASAPQQVKKVVHRHNLGSLGVYTQTVSSTGTETKLTTILKDHLGSTDALYTTTWNGSTFASPTTENQSFDAWGERRDPATLVAYRATGTDAFRTSGQDYDRGYTGHEQLDDSGLIHMNGRIYDPELGRMLSPDPVVQIPEYSQNFNRYNYVMNNPLNLTDPSGFSFFSDVLGGFGVHTAVNNWVKENWRTVVVVVVGVVLVCTGIGAGFGAAVLGAAATAATTVTAAGVTFSLASAISGAFMGGILGGLSAALNGGNLGDVLRGGIVGGIQGFITGGLLHGLEQAPGTMNAQTALHVAGHGVVGGAANAAMGGKFQDGFISGAVSAAAGDAGLYGPEGGGAMGVARRTAIAGVVGGTASALGGGKFANGAYTAAFQHLLNAELPNAVEEASMRNTLRNFEGRVSNEVNNLGRTEVSVSTSEFRAIAQISFLDKVVKADIGNMSDADFIRALGGADCVFHDYPSIKFKFNNGIVATGSDANYLVVGIVQGARYKSRMMSMGDKYVGRAFAAGSVVLNNLGSAGMSAGDGNWGKVAHDAGQMVGVAQIWTQVGYTYGYKRY